MEDVVDEVPQVYHAPLDALEAAPGADGPHEVRRRLPGKVGHSRGAHQVEGAAEQGGQDEGHDLVVGPRGDEQADGDVGGRHQYGRDVSSDDGAPVEVAQNADGHGQGQGQHEGEHEQGHHRKELADDYVRSLHRQREKQLEGPAALLLTPLAHRQRGHQEDHQNGHPPEQRTHLCDVPDEEGLHPEEDEEACRQEDPDEDEGQGRAEVCPELLAGDSPDLYRHAAQASSPAPAAGLLPLVEATSSLNTASKGPDVPAQLPQPPASPLDPVEDGAAEVSPVRGGDLIDQPLVAPGPGYRPHAVQGFELPGHVRLALVEDEHRRGAGIQLTQSSVGPHLAVEQHDDAVAYRFDLGEYVCREQNGCPVGEPRYQPPYLHDLRGVQADGRLVEDQHLGFMEDCRGQAHPLAESLAELADRLGEPLLQPCGPHRPGYEKGLVGLGDLAKVGHHPQIGLDRELRVQGRILRQVSDTLLDRQRVCHDVEVVDQYAAGVRVQKPGQYLHERGLAGAVGPQQPDDLAWPDMERYLLQRLDRTVSLAQAKYLNQERTLQRVGLFLQADTMYCTSPRRDGNPCVHSLGSACRGPDSPVHRGADYRHGNIPHSRPVAYWIQGE